MTDLRSRLVFDPVHAPRADQSLLRRRTSRPPQRNTRVVRRGANGGANGEVASCHWPSLVSRKCFEIRRPALAVSLCAQHAR